MNPHYHRYAELSSPHPPSPDNNNYPQLSGGGHHHNGHGPTMNPIEGHQQGFHHLNNNNLPIKQCAGCSGKITERYFLQALDRFWHNSCLKCQCCNVQLADIGSSCFTKSGMILCKSDYTRMFGSGNCSACGEHIPPNELVMRTTSQGGNQQPGIPQNNQNLHSPAIHHVYHIKCFRCSKCTSHLQCGDRYYMISGNLVCEQDWHKLVKTSTVNNATPPVRKGKVGRPRRSRD
ncbi:LIM domain transcription factor LMO4 [Bradysia coprophila]|uniref:LIM domain transcription factor LMO4 n=1 Tax=Bradysia coprophila TaxID=38358 RepID=UPI00187DCDA1|nr:LIM domain transcription factor LMO4 [Bradysia coprophila]